MQAIKSDMMIFDNKNFDSIIQRTVPLSVLVTPRSSRQRSGLVSTSSIEPRRIEENYRYKLSACPNVRNNRLRDVLHFWRLKHDPIRGRNASRCGASVTHTIRADDHVPL